MKPSLLLVVYLAVACAEADPAFMLTDVAAQMGVVHVSTSGGEPATRIVEVKGGGVALFDLENDGDLDIFVPNGATLESPESGPGSRTFENVSVWGGLRFKEVVDGGGPAYRGWAMGACVGDVDGDGFDDVYVSAFGADALLYNGENSSGDGHSLGQWDTPFGLGHDAWTTGCAFGDLDRDGDLDLYVAGYLRLDLDEPARTTKFLGIEVFEGPAGLPPEPDVLYENTGAGKFRDVTRAAGCADVAPSFGLGVVIADLDLDGHQDVFVGNDSMPNFLFRNRFQSRGAWSFEDVALASGLALDADGQAQATMGIAVGDVSGDGKPDLFSTNFSSDTNTLHVQSAGAQADRVHFSDRTEVRGVGQVTRPYLGWATGFADLDHDGDEDLVAFNGHVYPEAVTRQLGEERRQVPLLFERDGERFRRVAAGNDERLAWLATPFCDRGAAFGDLDRDGDVDIVVNELNGPLRILRNDGAAAKGGSSLVVTLADERHANRRGLGARLELSTDRGRQTRWILSGGSYLSANASEAHFGLAPGDRARSLTVVWPDGEVQTVDLDGAVPRVQIVRER